MPKDCLQITVLLASPGNVPTERRAVREAVEEINRVTGEDEGFHLVVKGWETHTRPAAGRPQGVINDQIGPTDIFLGIMWHRLGTPSGKAASGTVEEYERARQRYSRSRAAVKPSVMFYFRSTLPRKSTAFDPDQYKAVQQFKAKVFKSNLAREYETPKEFASLVRQHLTAEARSIARRHRSKSRSKKSRAKQRAQPPDRSSPQSRRKAPAQKAPAPRRTPSKPRRKPPLPVPKVRRTITNADRMTFAEKAFRSVRSRFERTAAAFNREHAHARITTKREGKTAFVVESEANGERRGLARVQVGDADWQGHPSLDYQRGATHSFYRSQPLYQTLTSVRVTERDGALGFERAGRVGWQEPNELDQAANVAAAFWDLFTADLT